MICDNLNLNFFKVYFMLICTYLNFKKSNEHLQAGIKIEIPPRKYTGAQETVIHLAGCHGYLSCLNHHLVISENQACKKNFFPRFISKKNISYMQTLRIEFIVLY